MREINTNHDAELGIKILKDIQVVFVIVRLLLRVIYLKCIYRRGRHLNHKAKPSGLNARLERTNEINQDKGQSVTGLYYDESIDTAGHDAWYMAVIP